MRTIAATELKRRGLAAVNGLLRKGPVHVLQRNKPACVMLSPGDYERLEAAAGGQQKGADVWTLLGATPTTGERSRDDIDAQIAAERASWDVTVVKARRRKPVTKRGR